MRKNRLLCLVTAIFLFASMLIAPVTAQDNVRIGCLSGLNDYYMRLFSALGLNITGIRSNNYQDYASMKEALENGEIDIAFPVVAEASESTAYLTTDCGASLGMSVVYKGTYSTDIFKSIALPAASYLIGYAEQYYPDSALITTYGSSKTRISSWRECLQQLMNGRATCVILPTSEVKSAVYDNSAFSSLNTVELARACSLSFAVSSTRADMAAAIHEKLSNAEIKTQVSGIITTYFAANQSSKNFFEEHLLLIVLLFIAAALAILTAFLIKHYRMAHREQMAAINCLSSDFECVTLLDSNSHHETRFRISESFSKEIPGWEENEDWSMRMRQFADKLVAADDRDRFIKEMSKERIIERLKEKDSYIVSYRIMQSGKEVYFRTKFVHDDESKNCIVAGFHNVDNEVRRELALQKKIQEKEMSDRLSLQIVKTLVKILEAKDKYTNGHSIRVATYAREIARRCGFNEDAQVEIYYMGLLHDIGKVGIPDNVINKTGRLSDEEFAIIKEHAALGAQILESINAMPKLRIGALNHHERYDGRGYPNGLTGNQIAAEARILCVADAYDAMSSPRSFRDALSQDRIRAEIAKGSGTQFDPKYAQIMLQMIDEDKDFSMRELYGMD